MVIKVSILILIVQKDLDIIKTALKGFKKEWSTKIRLQ